MRGLRHIEFLILLIVVGFACREPDQKDRSLTAQEYQKLGMPDHNKVWGGLEYSTACDILFKIKYQNPSSLPLKNSRKSGMIFNRLITSENFSFLNIDTLPLYKKAYQISTFVNIQSTLLDIYYDASRVDQYYSTELIHIYIFGLKVTEEMLELASQINESSDVRDQTMKHEFGTIRLSYMKMLQYVLDRMKHASLYTLDDFVTLGDSVTASIGRNLVYFDSVSVAHIGTGLQAVIDSSASGRIRKDYMTLMDTLARYE